MGYRELPSGRGPVVPAPGSRSAPQEAVASRRTSWNPRVTKLFGGIVACKDITFALDEGRSRA